MAGSQALEWFEMHADTLRAAREHIGSRGHWGAFPESPSERVQGEGSKEAGRLAFESHLGASFALPGADAREEVGSERSAYGPDLGVRYPALPAGELVGRAERAGDGLAALGPRERTGIALEAMSRLWARNFELAHAVMHTTGQGFVMAFQAGAAHALDRALEAVAYADAEMSRIPERVRWEKPRGKGAPIVLEKRYRVMPRGVGLVIACSTFPTWNGYPAIFANLACGNPVVLKPHPGAVLPLAITTQAVRETLADAGVARDALMLALDAPERPIAAELALDPRVRLIDYTGGSKFGEWLEHNARHARVFAEKSGTNCALVGPLADPGEMARNLALSLSLYSGQMCTSPQNIFVAKGQRPAVAEALSGALGALLSDDARAAEILGAIRSSATMRRLEEARSLPGPVHPSRAVAHPAFAEARVRTPHVSLLTVSDADTYRREWFGPVAHLIETEDAEAGLAEMEACLRDRGALTASVHTDDEGLADRAAAAAGRAGVNVAVNLAGESIVNHSAAFSDYHGTGANPACGACLTDGAFVAPRFYVAERRGPPPG